MKLRKEENHWISRLCPELVRIKKIHPQKQKNIWQRKPDQPRLDISTLGTTTYSMDALPETIASSESLDEDLGSLSTESLTSNIASVGSIAIGGASLSIGLLLVTLKRLCPIGNPGSIITGSLQKYGSLVCLTAHMEYLGNKSRAGGAWKISREVNGDEEIPELIKDLAFSIAYDLSNDNELHQGISASTWQSFKYLTEVFDNYNQYIITGNMDYLEMARENCMYAADLEKGSVILISLFRKVGEAYSRNGDDLIAEELINCAMDLTNRYNGD